nr:Chain C, Hybrid BTB-binding (HBP) peptide [synthetic construct]6TCJ_D Chain D, Hybrid BTB-binding (HBP) peptide [synthetic construct]
PGGFLCWDGRSIHEIPR